MPFIWHYDHFQTKNIMVSSYARTKEASQAKYISILNIIQGEVDPTQVLMVKMPKKWKTTGLLQVCSWYILMFPLCYRFMKVCRGYVNESSWISLSGALPVSRFHLIVKATYFDIIFFLTFLHWFIWTNMPTWFRLHSHENHHMYKLPIG